MKIKLIQIFLVIKVRFLTILHRILCEHHSYLDAIIPTDEHMKKEGGNEVYMLCPDCGKRYHLCWLETE